MDLDVVHVPKKNLAAMYTCGLASQKGRKEENQDAALLVSLDATKLGGHCTESRLLKQPVLLALVADGVSSCRKPAKASQMAVDYFYEIFCISIQQRPIHFLEDIEWCMARSLKETNAKLYFEDEHARLPGCLTTFVGVLVVDRRLVYCSVGDSRVYLFHRLGLECLTCDDVSTSKNGITLNQALGADLDVQGEFGFREFKDGDLFCVVSDGVTDSVDEFELRTLLAQQSQVSPSQLATQVLQAAWENGSRDNLTCVLAGFDVLEKDSGSGGHLYQKKIPQHLVLHQEFDGFFVRDIIHQSARSSVYKVESVVSQEYYAMKVPSAYFSDDYDYLAHFIREEHIGLSFEHEGLLRFYPKPAQSSWIYHLSECIEGHTLRQLLDLNGPLSHKACFDLGQKIMLSLRALHRNHYLHQDIKPDNILITGTTAKLIDFGSTSSLIFHDNRSQPAGSLQYAAPEYFSGGKICIASDLFSFAVVMYEMLTGKLPFTARQVASAHQTIQFVAPHEHICELPVGLVHVFDRAFAVNVNNRYQSISEFVSDLNPEQYWSDIGLHQPLLLRNPLIFWKSMSAALVFIIVLLLVML